jgi:hypothetical protein
MLGAVSAPPLSIEDPYLRSLQELISSRDSGSAVTTALQKCLSRGLPKDPHQRQDLRRCLDGEPAQPVCPVLPEHSAPCEAASARDSISCPRVVLLLLLLLLLLLTMMTMMTMVIRCTGARSTAGQAADAALQPRRRVHEPEVSGAHGPRRSQPYGRQVGFEPLFRQRGRSK